MNKTVHLPTESNPLKSFSASPTQQLLVDYPLGARRLGKCPIAGHIATANNIEILLLRKIEEDEY